VKITGQRSEIKGQGSEVGDQGTEVSGQRSEVRGQKAVSGWQVVAACFCLAVCQGGTWACSAADDFEVLCADRAAVERVYYNHRTGTKPPFEIALPADQVRRLVQIDLAKEAVLKRIYGVAVTAAMVEAEVQRINATTRAPEILAELKAALSNDPAHFARTVARPIVVERLLRNRFENDDKLHASQRREVEKMREQLLEARGRRAPAERSEARGQRSEVGSQSSEIRDQRSVGGLVAILKTSQSNAVTEISWQFGARRPDTNAPPADEMELKKRFGPEAQVLSSRHRGEKEGFYFEDLPVELQRILQVQLRQAGDVSAVIETPGGFLLYVCKERTAERLNVAALSLPKRSYEEWLAEQSGGAN